MSAPPLDFRFAGEKDVPILARMNRRLIVDERHRNRMNESELAERMNGWIGDSGDYRAALFFSPENGEVPVAYALYRSSAAEIYLRQFFVARDRRREGIGRAAMKILFDKVWSGNVRLTVDVLCQNEAAIEFWKAVGYRPYSVTLEIEPS